MSQMRRSLVCCFLVLFAFGAAVNLWAATLKVDPSMTRAAIQAVIDSAADNDTIRFAAGTYDFSATPFSVRPWSTSGGALVVTDKSLKFSADKGVVLLGKDSVLDPVSGIGTSGIIAFNINNSVTKDVSFKGFTFNKFLFGILSGIQVSYDPTSGAEVMAPSCRDFSVQNCMFQNIHRYAICATGIQRNIKIIKNTITWSLRMGIWLDWNYSGDITDSQPDSGKITMTNNNIHARQIVVYINRGRKMSIKNNLFASAGSDQTSEGLYINGGAYAADIVNNRFTNLIWGLDLNAWDAAGTHPLTGCKITNNKINTVNGIWYGGRDCHGNKFTNNSINVAGAGVMGVSVHGSYDDTFTNNKFFGSGDFVFSLTGFDETGAGGTTHFPHNNIFKKNSVKNFALNAECVHYFMGPVSHDNTAIGLCPENATYEDHGTNNEFTCIFPDSTTAAKFKKGFAFSPRYHFDRQPLER